MYFGLNHGINNFGLKNRHSHVLVLLISDFITEWLSAFFLFLGRLLLCFSSILTDIGTFLTTPSPIPVSVQEQFWADYADTELDAAYVMATASPPLTEELLILDDDLFDLMFASDLPYQPSYPPLPVEPRSRLCDYDLHECDHPLPPSRPPSPDEPEILLRIVPSREKEFSKVLGIVRGSTATSGINRSRIASPEELQGCYSRF